MINVCFLHARQDRRCAELMLASLRRHVKDCRIWLLTDEDEHRFPGCSVRRIPWDGTNVMEYRLRHLSELPWGHWILLDTDMIVQHDLSVVFQIPFEVAVTQRDGPIWDTNGNDLAKSMPYNGGLVWWRSGLFWHRCLEWIKDKPDAVKQWYGDQLALAAIVPIYGADALKLHCDNWNYTPRTEDEDTGRRFLVHYKRQRKEWMLRHGRTA